MYFCCCNLRAQRWWNICFRNKYFINKYDMVPILFLKKTWVRFKLDLFLKANCLNPDFDISFQIKIYWFLKKCFLITLFHITRVQYSIVRVPKLWDPRGWQEGCQFFCSWHSMKKNGTCLYLKLVYSRAAILNLLVPVHPK